MTQLRSLRVAIIGRTEMLLEAAKRIRGEGHSISLVATCKESGHELASAMDFQNFAEDCGAVFLKGVTQLSDLAVIRASQSDVAISMNWLSLIPAAVRDCFPMGVFNAHPGDLPRFKGNACPNWAILLNEPRVALTIHAMVDELDAGPVFEKRYLELSEDIDIRRIYEWLRSAVPDAFRNLIESAADGGLRLTPQSTDVNSALRCYPRRPEDGHISWQSPLGEVLRLIRASTRPFAGAFTHLEGERKLTIWSASRELTPEPFCAVPGQVAFRLGGDPVIAALDGYLRLVDVDLEGCASAAEAKAVVLSSLRNRLR